VAALSVALPAAVPQGWILAGSKPADYDTGVDAQVVYSNTPSAYLKSKDPNLCLKKEGTGGDDSECKGFGTLMQQFSADEYVGKRIRFSGFVKADGVSQWAGLWMRVDKGTSVVAFDNMQNRAIKGTLGWQHYEVVLDVPANATGIAFGILLAGPGAVWLNSAKFEPVGTDVPVTSPEVAKGPTNLGFEK
jgi:hypothetical protein